MTGPADPLPTPGVTAPLEFQPPDAVAVSERLSLLFEGEQVIYFAFTVPIASHRADDKRARNFCMAQCASVQLASQAELARAFELHPRTVLRAVQRLQSEGQSAFAKPFKLRRRHGIEDPELLRQAAQMLADGSSLRATARALELCYSTLRTYKLKGLLPQVEAAGQPQAELVAEPQAEPSGEPQAEPADEPQAEPAAEPTPGPSDPATAGSQTPPTSAEAPLSTLAAAAGGTSATPAMLHREERNRRDAQTPQGRATHDRQGRLLASLGKLGEAQPDFAQPASAVAGGGVLTALPALLAEGLLAHSGQLSLPAGFYGVRSILLTLAFLLLLRVRNAERLGYQQPGEWGHLLGLDRCPCPRTLRRRLRQLAQPEAVAGWRAALAQHWADENPDAVATLFVDGHVKVYTGHGRLPKQFVPRQKLCLPAATSYWVGALGGAPLLCLHKALDSSLVRELRERIVPQLEEWGLAGADSASDQEPRLTLVFDRAGWSPALFAALRRKGIAVISWHKGAQPEQWPRDEFQAQRFAVPGPLGAVQLEGWAAERKLELGKHGELREIRFWIERRRPQTGRSGQPRKPLQRHGEPGPGQRQPALVTTHPSLPLEEVAGLLRSRWTQENFFKYMREEFGLDTLAEHALEDVSEDEVVVNPLWRYLDNAVTKYSRKCGELHRRRAQAKRGSPAAAKLQAQLETAERRLEGLQIARRQLPRQVRVGELPANERPQALAEPLRVLLDAVRMLAYRAETRMAAALAPGLSRPETARTLIKALLCSDASLVPDAAAGTLTVRLLHQASRGQDRALLPLLQELNQTRTLYPGTQLRLVYEILPDTAASPPDRGFAA